MSSRERRRRFVSITLGGCAVALAGLLMVTGASPANAGCQCGIPGRHHHWANHGQQYWLGSGDIRNCDTGGVWYWMRSPEEERRVVMNLYNRYCIRCHGVDGRGVWDIPDVPDFTNLAWQASRPDTYRARIIMEGRGAVMPAFRGTLTLEEASAMGRYLHTFVPGTEVSRPDIGISGAGSPPAAAPPPPPTPAPAPAASPRAAGTQPPPAPAPNVPSPFAP